MTKRKTGLITILVAPPVFMLLAACASKNEIEPAAPVPEPLAAPSLVEAGNASIHGIYDYSVPLQGGRWEGEPFSTAGASRPTAGLLGDVLMTLDLDRDGDEESVVIVWESSGGSGSYSYLVVLDRQAGQVVNVATAQIGDRVQVRSLRAEDHFVELSVVQQGPEDGACCPSQLASRRWELHAGELVEQPPLIEGNLSVESLHGETWRLVELADDEPLPGTMSVTFVVSNNSFNGRGPCNNYFGDIADGEFPGSIKISGPGATRMACPDESMTIEARYFDALGSAVGVAFVPDGLRIAWLDGDDYKTMRFSRDTTD